MRLPLHFSRFSGEYQGYFSGPSAFVLASVHGASTMKFRDPRACAKRRALPRKFDPAPSTVTSTCSLLLRFQLLGSEP